jgi:hypothetical protein
VAIFGRIMARRRLRKATREAMAIPPFSSPADCTPWVTGGLWPAELATVRPENAALAEHLRVDLERITRSANNDLTLLMRAGLPDAARRAEEARIVDDARARAERRVALTVRALRGPTPGAGPRPPGLDTTRVMPAVRDAMPDPEPERPGRHRAAEPPDLN